MKNKFNWIILVVVAFIIILIIGFLTLKKPKFSYQISTQELTDNYLSLKEAISPQDFRDFTLKNDVIIIDLRKPSEYVKGHFEKAINIPFADLLSDDYKNDFKNKQEKVLYAENEVTALQAWMILRQIGYTNLKYLRGGYEVTRKIMLSDTTFNQKKMFDENLLYDFTSVNKTENDEKSETSTPPNPSPKPVIVKPRKNQPSGGC